MGYYVKSLPGKKTAPKWKLQFVSHKLEHTGCSNARKPKKEWDFPKCRWASLGIRYNMTVEEARGRVCQLNAKLHRQRQEEHL